MTQTNSSKNIPDLRQRAEERTTQEVQKAVQTSPEETRRLLHELSVHQIELELQNEELRNTQLELESSRRKYIDLYEFSPVGLLVLDADGRVQEPNFTFTQLIGIARPKLANRDFTLFIHSEAQDTFHFFFQRLRSTQQPQQCEVTLLGEGERPIPVRLDGIVLTQVQAPAKYRLAVTDLTAQKQAEEQMLQLVAEQQRMRVLYDFVRDLSHNIRIPLTTITTGLYLVGKMENKATQLQKIDEINKHVFALNATLDQLQQMAVLDNMTTLERPTENLNRLVADVIQAFKPRAIAEKVKLISKLDEALSPIPLNVTYMDRAIKNLLDNALRFTSKGGTVSVTISQHEGVVQLDVTDTGAGIDSLTMPHIFERFYKTSIPGHESQGTGLGLSLVQRIVELHHGSIDVQSTPCVQTIFTIRLPIN